MRDKELVLTAFKSHIDLLASMPGRAAVQNVKEATDELSTVCKRLCLDHKSFQEHCEMVLKSLTK